MSKSWKRVSPWRWTPTGCLLCVGALGALAASIANDPTWVSIWIGVAATCISAGLVDASAVIERRASLRPAYRIAAIRCGRANQLGLQLVQTVFGNLRQHEGDDISIRLRGLQQVQVDLSEDAGILPRRSRAELAHQLAADLTQVQEELRSFAAAGIAGDDLSKLDATLGSSILMTVARDVFLTTPRMHLSEDVTQDAARLIATLQGVAYRAQTSAGEAWRYGRISAPSAEDE